MKYSRLLTVIVLLIFLLGAFEAVYARPLLEPTVTLQIDQIEGPKADGTYHITGSVVAHGFVIEDPGTVYRNHLTVWAEFMGEEGQWPKPYRYWNHAQTCNANAEDVCLTEERLNGRGVSTAQILSQDLTDEHEGSSFELDVDVTPPEGNTQMRVVAQLQHVYTCAACYWDSINYFWDVHEHGAVDFVTPTPTAESEDPGDDADQDGIPDAEDLCRDVPGMESLCGCPDNGPAAGDLIFRYAKPSWGSFYAGYAEVGGEKYNFGHVGVYAGDFQANRTYQVRHKNGVTIKRLNASTQAWEVVQLKQGDAIQPGDVVPNAVIEGDAGYGGVGISNLSNFESDHQATWGSSAGGIMYGAPPSGLNCRQRRLVLERMAQFAADTDDGNFEYGLFSTNCSQTAAQAYTEAGLNSWQDFVSPDHTWTPNYVASWMDLSKMGEKRPGINPDLLTQRRVSIKVRSPAELHVYDSAGHHTGATADGVEANIPYSEYWKLEDDHKVFNLLAHAEDTYRFVLEGYAEGPVGLEIVTYNYFAPELAHRIAYQPIDFTPQTAAQLTLTPDQTPEASGLSLEIDLNGDGQVDQSAAPTIEEHTISAVSSPGVSDATTYYVLGGLGLLLLVGIALLAVAGGLLLMRTRRPALGGGTNVVQDQHGRWWRQDARSGAWSLWDGRAWRPAQVSAPSSFAGVPRRRPQNVWQLSCIGALLALALIAVLVGGGFALLAFGVIPGWNIAPAAPDMTELLKIGGGGLALILLGALAVLGGLKTIITRRAVILDDETGYRREVTGCWATLNGVGQLGLGLLLSTAGVALTMLALFQHVLPLLMLAPK